MSLINDALRRANQIKKQPPLDASGDVPMQPNPSATRSRPSSFAPMLLLAIVFAVFLGGFFFWKSSKTNSKTSGVTQVEKASSSQVSTPTPHSTAESVAPNSVTTSRIPTLPENKITVETPSVPGQVSSNSELVDPEKSSTKSVVEASESVPPPAPAPPPLKLQGIFYRLSNPTVLINGKTLGVGEMVSGARVLKIERQDVTVEREGQKIILTMH